MSLNRTPRKVKKLDESLYTFNLPSHSPVLSSSFMRKGDMFHSYLYKILPAPLFGLISPVQFPENSILQLIEPYYFNIKYNEDLKSFQQAFWTDLFKSSKNDFGSQSRANYYIVPIISNKIDWKSIKRAINQEPLQKLSDFSLSSRHNLILKTGYKSNATWIYINEVNHNTTVQEFLVSLMGSKHPDLKRALEVYEFFEPADVLFDENFRVQSVLGFRELLVSGCVKEFSEKTVLIFAKQTKSIKHQPPTCVKVNDYHSHGTPILISEFTYVFYLTVEHWDQGRALLNALIEIENFSYLIEFSSFFNFQGNFEILKEACQSPGYSSDCNYESLETLGDTVLKAIFTLHIYLNHIELNEFGLTRKRGWKVSNKYLSQIASKFDLKRFLKTKPMKTNNFRPAFYISKDMPNETYEIEQKVSESMLADFVEALIAAFYLSTGILEAGKFLLKLGIVNESGWKLTAEYLNNENLAVLGKEDIRVFPDGAFKISELLRNCPRHTGNSVFGYEFFSKVILTQALTHKTLCPEFNYERLEFLGDAVIDLIILTNIWNIYKFDPDYLTYLKHELVSNNTLAKITFATNLHKYMIIDTEIKDLIESNLSKSPWNEDPYTETDIILDMPKCLGDIFESVVAAILIDSNSLSMTCTVIGYVFSNIILYMVKNISRYKKRVIARLCEKVSRLGKKIDFKDYKREGVYFVQIFINNKFVYEDCGRSLKNAKDNACLEVFKKISSGEI